MIQSIVRAYQLLAEDSLSLTVLIKSIRVIFFMKKNPAKALHIFPNKNSTKGYVAPKQIRTVGSILGLSLMLMDRQTDGKPDPYITPCL